MTHQQKLEAVRQKCIVANPAIKSRLHISRNGALRCRNCGEPDDYENHGKCEKGEERPIRLADAINALRVANIHEDDWKEELCKLVNKWDCRTDDISSQPEETINFLYELLK